MGGGKGRRRAYLHLEGTPSPRGGTPEQRTAEKKGEKADTSEKAPAITSTLRSGGVASDSYCQKKDADGIAQGGRQLGIRGGKNERALYFQKKKSSGTLRIAERR